MKSKNANKITVIKLKGNAKKMGKKDFAFKFVLSN